jgi:hypothetical protein
VFLEIVVLTGDIGNHFVTRGQTNFSHLTQGRVRLLGRTCHHLQANAAALRTRLQGWRFGLLLDLFPSQPNQLVNRRHVLKSFFYSFPLDNKKPRSINQGVPFDISRMEDDLSHHTLCLYDQLFAGYPTKGKKICTLFAKYCNYFLKKVSKGLFTVQLG